MRWIGTVHGARLQHVLATARAALFPITWDEPGGTAVTESLALGCPCRRLPPWLPTRTRPPWPHGTARHPRRRRRPRRPARREPTDRPGRVREGCRHPLQASRHGRALSSALPRCPHQRAITAATTPNTTPRQGRSALAPRRPSIAASVTGATAIATRRSCMRTTVVTPSQSPSAPTETRTPPDAPEDHLARPRRLRPRRRDALDELARTKCNPHRCRGAPREPPATTRPGRLDDTQQQPQRATPARRRHRRIPRPRRQPQRIHDQPGLRRFNRSRLDATRAARD